MRDGGLRREGLGGEAGEREKLGQAWQCREGEVKSGREWELRHAAQMKPPGMAAR